VRVVTAPDSFKGSIAATDAAHAIADATPDVVVHVAHGVTGPDGRPVDTSTRGLGEVIVAPLDEGALDLVIGLGGSASTDVTAPLLGPTAAATVFGPQKGASPADPAHWLRRAGREAATKLN
jgi:glycerate kinase